MAAYSSDDPEAVRRLERCPRVNGPRHGEEGSPKGLLTFTEEDYAQSIVDFIADATASGTEQTFANYDKWVKEQSSAGIRRPSPASIRNFYGAWLTALRRASRPVPA